MKISHLILFISVHLIAPTLALADYVTSNSKYLVNIFSAYKAQSQQCYGTIIGTDKVLTLANCVYGFDLIKACPVYPQLNCPQNPVNCVQPTKVLLHQKFIDSILIGEVRMPFAVLMFQPNTFRQDQVVSINVDAACKCKNQVNEIGYTYECFGCEFSQTKVKIVDFTADGLKYGYPKNSWPFFYTLPVGGDPSCIGLSGSPLFVNKTMVGLNAFCRPQCGTCPSYTLFTCIEVLNPLFLDLTNPAFVDLRDANQQYYDYTLDQQLHIQRSLDPFTRPICRTEALIDNNIPT